MTPRVLSAPLFMSDPTLGGTPGFSRVKSLLIVCHEFPPSLLLNRTFAA